MSLSKTVGSTANHKKIAREIDAYIQRTLSAPRYRHCVLTAELCGKLCERFGCDPERGRLAGLGHDIAREFEKTKILETAERDGLQTDSYEAERPILLHGRAGAVFLRENFGLDDEEILEAVRRHTLGHPEAGVLTKILYAADYCEPSRAFLDDVFRRRCMGLSLDEMVLQVLEHEKTRRPALAPISQAMYDILKGRVGEG